MINDPRENSTYTHDLKFDKTNIFNRDVSIHHKSGILDIQCDSIAFIFRFLPWIFNIFSLNNGMGIQTVYGNDTCEMLT